MAQAVILIPARYESSRFLGKPLALIHKKPMIQVVYENMKASGFDVAVVTDNDEIQECVEKIDGVVYRVDDDVPSGSERIGLALNRFLDSKYEYVINVQGDEPLLSGEEVKNLLDFHVKNENFDITTLGKLRQGSGIEDPDIVKLVRSNTGECLYFSRACVPYDRDQTEASWYQHIGVYCYKTQALKKFLSFEPTALENIEKLEQLRALENSMKIGALITDADLIGVDRPEDINKVEKFLEERK